MGQNSDLKIKIEIFTLMLSGFKTLNAATQVATLENFNWLISMLFANNFYHLNFAGKLKWHFTPTLSGFRISKDTRSDLALDLRALRSHLAW